MMVSNKFFKYKNLIIKYPEDIIAIDLEREQYSSDWVITIIFRFTDFLLYFNDETMGTDNSTKKEAEARRIYEELKEWAEFNEEDK